jgi:uncharacterized membrane protein
VGHVSAARVACPIKVSIESAAVSGDAPAPIKLGEKTMQLQTIWPWALIVLAVAIVIAYLLVRRRQRAAQLAEDLAAISERRREQQPVPVDHRGPDPRK